VAKTDLTNLALIGGAAYLLTQKLGTSSYWVKNIQVTNVRLGYGNLVLTGDRGKPNMVLYVTLKNNTDIPIPVQAVYAELTIPEIETFPVGVFQAGTKDGAISTVMPGQEIELGVQGGIKFKFTGGTFNRTKQLGIEEGYNLYDDVTIMAILDLPTKFTLMVKGIIVYNEFQIPFERQFYSVGR
jgi:hypothetical protein